MYQAGLVLEGGGMRGMYTCGVLEFFLEKGIEFSHCYGVSAGSCHLCSLTSAGVRISNVYQIYFRITKEANTKVFLQVGNKEKVDVTDKLENGSLYTDAIKATENDKVFTVSLVKDGEAEATSTITYSINSYVNSKYDSVQIGDLVKAISNYGKSANAYQSK